MSRNRSHRNPRSGHKFTHSGIIDNILRGEVAVLSHDARLVYSLREQPFRSGWDLITPDLTLLYEDNRGLGILFVEVKGSTTYSDICDCDEQTNRDVEYVNLHRRFFLEQLKDKGIPSEICYKLLAGFTLDAVCVYVSFMDQRIQKFHYDSPVKPI